MPQRYYFGVTMTELFMLISAGFFGGLLVYFIYPNDPFWVYLGMAFSVFVVGHMCIMAPRAIILPELIAFVTCLQWLIAPWLSYHNPPGFKMFVMAVPQEEYFSFTVPASIALWIGLHLPLKLQNPGVPAEFSRQTIGLAERRFFDAMIIFGFFITYAGQHLPGALGFLYYILSQLRFVGAFSHYYSRSPGATIRLIIVYASLFVSTSAGGVFYELVLWSGFLLISIAYVRGWRWKLLAGFAVAFSLLIFLNDIKYFYRTEILKRELSKIEKVIALGELALDKLTGKPMPSAGKFNTFGDKLVRYNQGWITARVMETVPRMEPYAEGRTVVDAFVASVVPRVFLPEKTQIASKETFLRYTNVKLSQNSSMALGIAGEMYANFGRWGGSLATFLYGILIGFIFSKFARRARENFLWWAWAPFVLISAVEAEWNLVDIMNGVIKSLMVMLVLIYFVPILKRRMVIHAPRKA